jgi:hypothetical protein
MRFDEAEVRSFGRELTNVGTLGVRRKKMFGGAFAAGGPSMRFHATERMLLGSIDSGQMDLFDVDEPYRFGGPGSALALLRFAELGIDDVQIVEELLDFGGGGGDPRARRHICLLHRVDD